MRERIITAILLAIIAVGCVTSVTDDTPEPIPEGAVRLSVNATVYDADNGVAKDSFASGDTIGVYAIRHTSDGSYALLSSGNYVDNAPYTYKASTETWSSTVAACYADDSTPVDIIAYYPYMKVTNARSIEIHTPMDQSRANAFDKANVLWCRVRGVTPTDDDVSLIMKPLLAYVELQLLRGTGWDDDEWQRLSKSVAVCNTLNVARLDLMEGALQPKSGETGEIRTMADNSIFRAAIIPQRLTAGTQLFKVAVDDAEYQYALDEETTFAAAKRYTFTMTIDKEGGTPPPDEVKLSGAIIGTRYSVDYDTSQPSETVNTKANVFDGDLESFFASYDRSNTWVGLDLGAPHVITRLGYAPRPSQPERVVTALIEGANNADFSDALPIYIIKESAPVGELTYADISCSRGFRYVRYVTPNDKRCNIAELEFYGYAATGDDSRLYQLTNLPTVVINTDNAVDIVSKVEEVNSHVFIISDNGTSLLEDSATGVRGRGNASWDFPKKPYRLHFSQKCSPLGAPAEAKKWTLISNYGDKSLMRNIVAFELSRRLGLAYTPFCRPVDLILNGEYKGCYQLCDQIDVRENRVDITEMTSSDNSGDRLQGGYIIDIDAYAYSEAVYFYSNRGTPVTIKSPDDKDITAEQRDYIIKFFNDMENAVYASNYTDHSSGYRKYLDLDSFLRHFIVGELAGNTDTYWSVYMYKDRTSDKLYTGPIWDYDLAFENDSRTYPINSLGDYIYAARGSVASETVRTMVTRIVKQDAEAKRRLVEIWNDVRATAGIDAASLAEYVDEMEALLSESAELNFKRWPILNQYVHMNFQALGSYKAEVGTVRNYIKQRVAKLDELIK